jgi:hypothetical protein
MNTHKAITLFCLTDEEAPAGCDARDCNNAAGCTLNSTGQAECFCRNGFELTASNTCTSKPQY